jgi:hypothetical protein
MMAAMHARVILWLTIGPALLGCFIPASAQAQFYDLDGAYHCLTVPNDACKASQQPMPPLPPPPPTPPSVDEVIARIRDEKVTAADIDTIETLAAAKEPRAVEALAWCKLKGIGVPSDPVEAYFLYGEAAQLGIPTATSNQIAIFETQLDADQRQLVLAREQIR